MYKKTVSNTRTPLRCKVCQWHMACHWDNLHMHCLQQQPNWWTYQAEDIRYNKTRVQGQQANTVQNWKIHQSVQLSGAIFTHQGTNITCWGIGFTHWGADCGSQLVFMFGAHVVQHILLMDVSSIAVITLVWFGLLLCLGLDLLRRQRALGTHFKMILKGLLISQRLCAVSTRNPSLLMPLGMLINLILGDKTFATNCTQIFLTTLFMGLFVLA